MRYLHTLVITGFLIPFLPLCAESADSEGAFSSSSAIYAPSEDEATLSSLEEELSLLDEEFEEFKEELFSLENELQKKDQSSLLEQLQDGAKTSESAVAAEHAEELHTKDKAQEPILHLESSAQSKMVSNPQETMTMELVPVSMSRMEKSETALTEYKLTQDSPATLNVQGSSLIGELSGKKEAVSIDLKQAFAGSPIIYSILFSMSVIAVGIWVYSLLSLARSARFSGSVFKNVQNKLNSNHFDEAFSICSEQNNLFCKMVATGIQSRRHGLPIMIEAMKAEGKRASTSFWQKLSLLNDIAIIAPMIGLLGTVLGMFYAFYDVNRSIESITTLFDGLGISVGTTVAGLIVAILALILHSTAKYRLVKVLSHVESEAQSIATLIDDRTSIYKG